MRSGNLDQAARQITPASRRLDKGGDGAGYHGMGHFRLNGELRREGAKRTEVFGSYPIKACTQIIECFWSTPAILAWFATSRFFGLS
jgi:hypothetical protein